MNNIRKFVALAAFLVAFSFVGTADYFTVNPTNGIRNKVEGFALKTNEFEIPPTQSRIALARKSKPAAYPTSIPGIGSSQIVREYRAVTGTDLAVNCFQVGNDGEDIFLVPISEYRSFKNYDDFVIQLKGMLIRAASIALSDSNKLLDPTREVSLFFSSGTFIDYGNGEFFNVGNFFGRKDFAVEIVNGKYTLPEGALNNLVVQISEDMGWKFDFPVEYVKLISRDLEGQIKFTWDTTINGAERHGYARSGELYLGKRFCFNGYPNEGSEDVRIQLTFESGKKLIFDGFGRLITPSLKISPTSSAVFVSVVDGMLGETYAIGSTINLKSWHQVTLKVTAETDKVTFPITNDFQMFRLQ